MNLARIFSIGLVLSTTGLAALACSSDETSSSSGSPSSSSDAVTVRVSAATGGTVADKDGKAKLDIPAGALEKDTDITLKISEKSGNAVAEVADFGPDGLTFLKPATLSLKGDPSLAPEGKSLAVALESGGTFTAIAGSTFANGVATASIEHFSKFSLVVVDGKISLESPASCQEAREQFKQCDGGDPTGTWRFAHYCPDPSQLPDPFKGQCADGTVSVEISNTQEVILDGKTMKLTAGQVTQTLTFDFPLTCAQAQGATSCSDVAKDDADTTCTEKGSGQCQCVKAKTEQKPEEPPKSYTTSGSTWTNETGSTGEYCVGADGKILYYREMKDGKPGLVYVLERK